MSDEELKLTRRLFMQHAAMASAMAGGLHSIALKTDALADAQPSGPLDFRADGPSPYPYMEPPV
jgi:hypothetical protein